MTMSFISVNIFLFALVSTCFGANKLESYNADPASVTVSGLSSGGAMAMQFHVAYSSIVHGSGIFAGLPFSCAKGGLVYATQCMSNPGAQVVATLVNNINTLANSGKIDPTSNLSGDKVFIFHGTKDTTVGPAAATKIRDVYQQFNADISTKLDMGAVHGFPTNFYGAACGSSSATTQYINNCNYHGAFEALNFLYSNTLTYPSAKINKNAIFANLAEYDQGEFGGNLLTSMHGSGYIYVPTACATKATKCKFHISLHGCQQSRSTINDIYAKNTGYLEVAEANNIIVIFPQTVASVMAGNPNACWDWWGYLNANYLEKAGAQQLALKKMIDRAVYCDGAANCFADDVTTTTTTTTTTQNPVTGGPTTTVAPGSCEPNVISFKPFPGYCEYYTLCACGGNEILLQCAPGLYFDPSINSCNFIQLVNCEPGRNATHF